MRNTRTGLALLVLAMLSCSSPAPAPAPAIPSWGMNNSWSMDNLAKCNIIPREYRCTCDGQERPATASEKRAAGACNAIYAMCEGKVSGCEAPIVTINRPFFVTDAGPDLDAEGHAQ